MQLVNSLLHEDLQHILSHTKELWNEIRNKTVFITGGTGFFGKWLLESFVWANNHLDLQAKAVVLTRNPDIFLQRAPHLAQDENIVLHKGDVTSFDYPRGSITHIIHAATESSSKLNDENPLLMFNTIIDGTKHVLEFARSCGSPKMLFTSSGAVYGKQPSDLTHIPEEYNGGPDQIDSRSAYGEGKRAAELLCALYSRQYSISIAIARCFAFVGPYLPLDIHFAIGNFIDNRLHNEPIHVRGDGTPYRSYLYASDLAIWLWTILFRGKSERAYNVGSDQAITISELAYAIAQAEGPPLEVHISKSPRRDSPSERYVPKIQRAKTELKLEQWIPLPEAILRTIQWYRQSKKLE